METVVQDVLSFFGLGAKLNFYILVPVCGVVALLVAGYFRGYQWPAQKIRERLVMVVTRIRAMREEPGLSLDDVEDRLFTIFDDASFGKEWADYRHSLHTVQSSDAEASVKAVLATSPAEAFFSKESIVDLKINADFYRHLPGILTGIGIIGTFSGLVWGLHQFAPDPDRTFETLPLLLQEVTSAFVGSGLAILAAMFVTYKEKAIITSCYRLVEELNREIDSMYTAGAGEAYLARLVMEAESGKTAAQGLKSALVNDIARLLHGSTERHIAAQQLQAQAQGQLVAEAIREALAGPMASLSQAVREVTRNQQDAVGGLIDNIQTGFMDKLGDTFGGQIDGITHSLRQSSDSIGEVQAQMTRSIADMAGAGAAATERMAVRLDDMLARMAEAQAQMAMQLTEQQRQFATIVEQTVETATGRLHAAMGAMADARVRQIEQDRVRHEQLLAAANTLYASLSDNVGKMVADIRHVTDGVTSNLSAMQETVFTAAEGVQQGAIVIRDAAEKFTQAGNAIVSVSGRMDDTAHSMQSTAGLMRQAFAEYEALRTSVERQVLHLQEMTAQAARENGINAELVDRMAVVVENFANAERESRDYLARINEVLKQSFQEFGVGMIEQVRTVGDETSRQLGTSLQALSGTVDSMVVSVSKLRRVG